MSGRVTGMGGHQSASSQTKIWLTPKEIVHPLGDFDLDPCCHETHPHPYASTRYYPPMNGLELKWFGRVWLNPPYSTQDCDAWLRRMVDHGNGIAIVFARTETQWFHEHVWEKADGVLFLKGRVHFLHPDGTRSKLNSGAPSCLVAYGRWNAAVLSAASISNINGHYIQLY